MPRYRETHQSIHDGSPAMEAFSTPELGIIVLVNEDGFSWIDPIKEWEPIGTPPSPSYCKCTGASVCTGCEV